MVISGYHYTEEGVMLKKILPFLILVIFANLLAWMFVQAWDAECEIREQQAAEYRQMMGDRR